LIHYHNTTLLHNLLVGAYHSSTDNVLSWVAIVATQYSTSVVDKDIIGCLLLHQEIAHGSILNT
jgi:hypothetical protein